MYGTSQSMFRIAKEKKARLWKDYSPSGPTVDIKDKTFSGKVRHLELCNGSKKICTIATFLHCTIYFNGILDTENLFCFYIYNYVIMLRRVFV